MSFARLARAVPATHRALTHRAQQRAMSSRLTVGAFYEGKNLAKHTEVDPSKADDTPYVVEDNTKPSFQVPDNVKVFGFKYPGAKAPDNKVFFAVAPKNPPMVLTGETGEYVQNLYLASYANDSLMKTEQELKKFVLPLSQDEDIGGKFFNNPTIETQEKLDSIEKFVKEHKVSDIVAGLLYEVVGNNQAEFLEDIVSTFSKLMQTVRCEATAEVHFGRIPTVNELANVKHLLQELRSPQQYYVHSDIFVDPNLGGGLKLKIGDFELDGSLNTRCTEVQKHLVKTLQ